MSLPLILAVIAGLLVVIGLVQPAAARAQLSPSVLLALVGVAIALGSQILLDENITGPISNLAEMLVDPPIDSEAFLYIFLPALLFQTSLTLDLRRLSEDAAPILALAVVAVVVATVMIGWALAPFSGLPLVACLLLGAIVATTDPIAVVDIFRDVGAPARLGQLVEGESLLNDAAAITLFTLLLHLLIDGQPIEAGTAVATFLKSFLGGVAVGYLFARLFVALLPLVRDYRLAQVTFSAALPYLMFVVSDHLLDVSGVVAVVVGGLVFGLGAPARVRPDAWTYLKEVWEQIAFWASSLIFVLASLLVPSLIDDIGWSDVALLAVLVVAALAARAAVLYGFLPILSALRLSEQVSAPYKTVILWGGMRGAVTLALALAVTENAAIAPEIKRFVAVLATGFVLFTLLVYGTTLRSLVSLLKLDQLTPFDAALRTQVLTLARADVQEATTRIAKAYHIDEAFVEEAVRAPAEAGEADSRAGEAEEIADRQRIALGLITLAGRERELILDHFHNRTLSARHVGTLLAGAARLLDAVRSDGRIGYNRAARRALAFSPHFRWAQWLHRRLGVERFLADLLAERFERLLVYRIILRELSSFVHERVAAVLGERAAGLLAEIIEQRREATATALEALQLQYPAYAEFLERRFLRQSALRREELEYEELFEDGLIGPELFGALRRSIAGAREDADRLPRLDLGLNTRELVDQVPLFAGLTDRQRYQLSTLLRPHFAMPAEKIIRKGERGHAMYFISSGAVEVDVGGTIYRLGRGDFFGELALLTGERRQADVTALGYCHLLLLHDTDFKGLLARHGDIQRKIDEVAAARRAMNRAAACEPTGRRIKEG